MGGLRDFNNSMQQINVAQMNARSRDHKIRQELIQPMLYALQTEQPLPAPFPTKQDIKEAKGFSNRYQLNMKKASAKKNQDLQRLYDDYTAGIVSRENAIEYLKSQS